MAKLPDGVAWYLHDIAMGLRRAGFERGGKSPLDKKGLRKPRWVAGDWVITFDGEEVYKGTSRESAWKYYFKMLEGM